MLSIDLLRENKVLESIANFISDGVNVVNNDGVVVYANEISGEYAGVKVEDMIGEKIVKFYPDAVLLNVLENKKPMLDRKIHYIGGKRYIVSAYPIVINGEFEGAFSVFRDIREIDELNRKIQALQLHLHLSETEEDISSLIGVKESLRDVLGRAKRTIGSIGGPRHSIIIGDSGTGKTMLAKLIYNYGRQIGTLDNDAPFIEVNCAQFTNSDIAALEIFGSEEGSFTGATEKKGLLERANGGVLFLDEAHQLGNYQSILLTAIETGRFRRLGGTKEISVDVIIIAASTKNLKNELLPELYQRLAQYELYLPPLNERSEREKEELFYYFINKYENAVKEHQGINYEVNFSNEARKL
ncbi:MAG: sigma 54-interacting transcriptional regulator, partial [Gallicola sp.]|nr:sigma 54-interacting transcriptional regulator [Gallicola sp.]